jgi:hypothetical protein
VLEVHLISLSSLQSKRALIKKIINVGQVLALVGKNCQFQFIRIEPKSGLIFRTGILKIWTLNLIPSSIQMWNCYQNFRKNMFLKKEKE